LAKNATGYTYDNKRKLGALIPLEAERSENTDKPLPQVFINAFRNATGEDFWTNNEIKLLRKAALCELYHYYRALKTSLKKNNNESLLAGVVFDRDQIAINIMKGMTVSDAFKASCGEQVFENLTLACLETDDTKSQ